MKKILSAFAAITVFTMFLFSSSYAGTGDATITFWGQSAFKIETGGKTILFDPWITYNPLCPVKVGDIKTADLIFISHDHFDHVGETYDTAGNPIHAGDTIAIARNTGAIVVAEYETAKALVSEGLPTVNVLYGGYGKPIGGPITVNGITIVSTPAVHSSDTGVSVGWIITLPGGQTIYHAGDTAIFGDMQIYGTLYPMTMALLPIGGYGQMDAVQAAQSLKLLKPANVIPMHYGTFPGILAPSADDFVVQAKKVAPDVNVIVLKPGESFVLPATK